MKPGWHCDEHQARKLNRCVSPAKPEPRRSAAVYEEEHQLVPRARGLGHDAMGDISCPQLSKFL